MPTITRICLLSVFSVVACLQVAVAQQCTDKPECWPDGSAMNVGLTYAQKQRVLATELGTVLQHMETMLKYDPGIVSSLKAQQVAWSSYKETECSLIGALYSGAEYWQSTKAVECEMNLTSQRLHRARDAFRCVKRNVSPMDWEYRHDCLYQLAPLAVPLVRKKVS